MLYSCRWKVENLMNARIDFAHALRGLCLFVFRVFHYLNDNRWSTHAFLLSNLKNKREDAFEQHGLDLIKGEPGYFYLNEQLGQAHRNVEFCLMVSELLRQKGITSSVVKVRD